MASLDLKSPEFWDPSAVDRELRRVYDICSGCRRCLPLCPSFKVLFDRLDVDAVDAVVGIHKNRNLPKFHRQTFSAWFKSRARRGATAGNASAAGVATARGTGDHVSAAGVPTGGGTGDHVSAAGVPTGRVPAAYKVA